MGIAPILSRAMILAALCCASNLAPAQNLSCDASPFGGAIALQSDREVMLGIVGRNVDGVADVFQYNDDRQNVSGASGPLFSGLTEWKSVAVDLNGDGKEETAYAGIDGTGTPVIAVVDENAAVIDTWRWSGTGSDIEIAASDYIGGQDRKRELVVAWKSGATSYIVAGFEGTSTGALSVADGQTSFRFNRDSPGAQHIALTSGDFLLEGREQIAFVIIGEPSGTRLVTFDLLFRTNTGQNVARRIPLVPEDIFSESIADIQAVAGYFGAAAGQQLAVAIQYETQNSELPLELWVQDFEAERDASGDITLILPTTISQVSQGSSELPQVPRAGIFDLAVGDIVRDGVDELLLAYPNESPDDNLSIRIYKYRPADQASNRFPTYVEHNYPLSAVSASLQATDVDSVSIDANDINGDGFADAVTAIAYGQNYDLREWQFQPPIAEAMGEGCLNNQVIGSTACPNSGFLPFPDELETDGLPAQGNNLTDFRQQPAAGVWELCVSDSAPADTGSLQSWTLRINDEPPSSTSAAVVPIPDNSGSPDACQLIDFNPASPDALVDTVTVDVAITHTWVGDLSIELKSPLGSRLTLLNRPGRSNSDFGNGADLSSAEPITFSSRATGSAQIFGFSNPAIFGDVFTATVALADSDGDSVVALRSATAGVCRSVSESLVQNVVYMPPVFPEIQDRNRLRAQIGEAASSGQRDGTEVQRRAGNSVSGYIGSSIGGSALGFTAKASARATAGRSYESTTQQSESSSSSLTVSQAAFIDGSDGLGGLVVRQQKTHDCYQYPVFRDGSLIDDSFMRFCELISVNQNIPSVEAWNRDIPTPLTGTAPAEWAPLVRDWANLALGANTNSSGAPTPESNAVDGLIDSGMPFSMDSFQENAFFLVDLGQVMEIDTIRIHVPSDRRSDLRRLSVFAYEFPRSIFSVPSGPDVSEYSIATGGGVLDIVNISTVTRLADGTRAPKTARFIVIRSPIDNEFGRIALDEIQVFGPDEPTPEKHPVAVCDPAWGDGWFRAKTYVRGNVNDFVWVDVMGDLDWRPTLPAGSTGLDCFDGSANSPQVSEVAIFENTSLSGVGNRTWDLDNSVTQSLENSSSITHSARYGAEIDIEVGGIIPGIMAGGGFEINSGVTRAESSELFWSNSTNVGGILAGIPNTDIGPSCDYMARPFAYRGRHPSNTGYTHRPLIVDYLVETKTGSWTHAGGVPLDCLTSDPVSLTVRSTGISGVFIFAEPEIYSGNTDYVIQDLVPSATIQLLAPASVGSDGFVRWTGCDSVDGTLGRRCLVQVDTDRTITVEYEPSEPELIAHWPFEDNADDISGNGFHGQMAGSASFSDGAVGRALDLRNGPGWVDLPSNILNQLNACSMSVWINLASYDPGDPGDSCCNAIYNEDNFFFNALHSQFIPADDPDTLGWVLGGLTGQQGKVAAPALDTWTHYVMTYRAGDGSYEIFRNGTLAEEGTHQVFGGGPIPRCGSGLAATIGAWDQDGNGNITRFFDGQIDDLRLYTQQLSPEDVLAIAQEGAFTLTVESTGVTGVAVTATPSVASGATNYTVPDLDVVSPIELTAPVVSGNFEFVSWSGCDSVQGASNATCLVSMGRDRTVVASYELAGFDLSVRSIGAQPVDITAQPASAGGSTDYTIQGIEKNTAITLTAPASSGALGFTGWIGCDASLGDGFRQCEVLMDRDRSTTATYDDISDDVFRSSFE